MREFEVYITPSQLSQVLQKAVNNPRKMIIGFLEVFFTREILSVSSAKGKRIAHNKINQEKTEGLPEDVIDAIKNYTLKHFKKISGEPCLTDAAMHDVINSKCATARRSMKEKKGQL